MTEQPVRHTVDTITSDALDALYEQLEAAQQTELARQLAICDKAFISAHVRATRAEAAIARVRKLADDWAVLRTHGSAAYELRAALNEPKEPRP